MTNLHKRRRSRYSERHEDKPVDRGVAATLQQLNDHDGAEWEMVDRRSKKQKKNHLENGEQTHKGKDNKPGLTYVKQHQLSQWVKVGDLQSLVLYCIADGTSPSWIAVRHHGQVQKAVVLLVPGLEMAMFNGEIDLPAALSAEENKDGATEPASDKLQGIGIEAEAEADIKSGFSNDKPSDFATDERDARKADSINENIPLITEGNRAKNVKSKNPDDYLPMTLKKDTLPLPLRPLAEVFDFVWPVKAPGDDKYYKLHSPLHAMLTSPISKSQEEKLVDKQRKGPGPPREEKNWKDHGTPITEFLASNEELQDNDFVVHPACYITEAEKAYNLARREATKTTEADGWRDTVIQSLEDGIPADEAVQAGGVTAGRTVFCIDCEMCMVEGDELALTRISIVGWDGEVILDEYIKPEKPITDYLTPYSGITVESLAGVKTTLTDIQRRLLDLFQPLTILVGHSLDSDLRALKMTHPFLIDTSLLFPHPRGPPLKSSLKWLTQRYLHREIQKGHGSSGHSSIEDARATLDLVKQKCKKGPSWGSSQARTEPLTKRLLRAAGGASSASAPHEEWDGKISAVVDHGAPERNFGSLASHCLGCKDDAEVVAGVRRAVLGDPDGAQIPGKGVRFTWARLRELEALRGWWNDNKSDEKADAASAAARSVTEPAVLAAAVAKTVEHIVAVRNFLPPCTLFIVYSGSGDPRELARLQEMQRTFKREYAVKKWDELSVRWTDVEEQALKAACRSARAGLGLVCIT